MKLLSVALSLASLSLWGCGSDSDPDLTSSESVSEIAASSISGAAASSDGGALAYQEIDRTPRVFAALDSLLSPFASAFAATACPIATAGTCSGSAMTLTYSDCQFLKPSGLSFPGVWKGSQVLTFDSGTCGVTFPPSNGTVITRTFGDGTTRTLTTALNFTHVVGFDTTTGSGWDTAITPQVKGGTTVTLGTGSRTIKINGIHMVATLSGLSKKSKVVTKTVWDHTVSTGSDITITGAGASRSVTGGQVVVQHNLALYTGKTTITTPLTFTAGCCQPTGGSITTALTGSITGSETLTFTSTCGSATLVDWKANSSTVALTHCF